MKLPKPFIYSMITVIIIALSIIIYKEKKNFNKKIETTNSIQKNENLRQYILDYLEQEGVTIIAINHEEEFINPNLGVGYLIDCGARWTDSKGRVWVSSSVIYSVFQDEMKVTEQPIDSWEMSLYLK